jgi:MarR family transcriptional regulator, 2-MHQ and catechol-resistance regulon repressor
VVRKTAKNIREGERLFSALQKIVRQFQFRDLHSVGEYGITITECYVLDVLADQGPISLNQAAAAMNLDKSTMSRVVRSLEEKKHLTAETDPEDARALQLELTSKGRKLHTRIAADMAVRYADLLAGMQTRSRGSVVEAAEALAARLANRGCD